jgi:two-component system, OmpR family, sensor histidine kinase TctE
VKVLREFTLANRIATSVVVCVLALSAVEMIGLHASLKANITAAHDRLLAAATYTIADSLHLESGEIRATLPLAIQEAFESAGGGPVNYWVGGNGDTRIAGDAKLRVLASSVESTQTSIGYRDSEVDGAAMRAAVLRFPMEMSEGQGIATIVVAHGDAVRRRAIADAMLGVLLRQALFLIVAGVAIVFIVRRLLRPVRDLRDQVDARAALDNRPFRGVGLAELSPVVDALNGLLGRLAVARAQQERFLANASHQLRTPLSVLKVQLQSAQRPGADREQRLREMLMAVNRAARLTDQLLALARVHQGRGADEQADLREVLDEALVELSPLIADKALAFAFEGQAVGRVNGSPWLIGELLRNLLLNAIQHSASGQDLQVSVRPDQGRPRVDIADSGPGIPQQMLTSVFEPFATVAGRSGGSGLGLAICKEIADAIGAELVLDAREPGPGLVASVRFAPALGR